MTHIDFWIVVGAGVLIIDFAWQAFRAGWWRR